MKVTKKLLKNLVEQLNEQLGEDKYTLDYCKVYGGWALLRKENIRDYIHRDDRLSAKEMFQYLMGLLNGIRAINKRNITTTQLKPERVKRYYSYESRVGLPDLDIYPGRYNSSIAYIVDHRAKRVILLSPNYYRAAKEVATGYTYHLITRDLKYKL